MTEYIQALLEAMPALDAANLFEFMVLAAVWVIACNGAGDKKKPYVMAAEYGVMTAVILLSRILLGLLVQSALFILLWDIVLGAEGYAYLRLRSLHRKSSVNILWAASFGSMVALSSSAGAASYMAGLLVGGGLPEAVARAAVFAFMLLAACYLCIFNFDDYYDVPRSGTVLLMICDSSVLAMKIAQISLRSEGEWTLSAVICVAQLLFMVVGLAAVWVLYSLCDEQAKVIRLQADRQHLMNEQEQLRLSAGNLDALRSIRHDIKNQFAYMGILVNEGRYEELKEYLADYRAHMPEALNQVHCGNASMDTIINMEFGKARQAGVTVSHQLVVPPVFAPVLPFTENDLCSIIANLVDNAIEECVRLKEQGLEAGIRLEICPKGSYLYIKCSNETDKTTLEKNHTGIRSTKGNDETHGYGTRIVAKLAERYNGAAEYKLDDGRFVASVILDMTPEEN